VQISFHPTASNLLIAATNEHTSSSLRFFDLESGEEKSKVSLNTKGIFSFSISPDGDLFAIATKDGQIIVLDPRTPNTQRSGKAHDSPRSFQLTWISPSLIVSVGFNRGSQRRINLYNVTASSVETIHSMMIDISPSVLFPSYDPDTRILYIWGKGERAISAYEVNLENKNEPISKLPTYTSGEAQMGVAFKMKSEVDVKKVEVMKALRMTGKTIEEVTFSIPRNKVSLKYPQKVLD
jgi:WD40 repeat protein